MRFFIALLILLLSFSANASTTVFFLNGIDGYDKKNMVSAQKIASALIKHNVITPSQPIVFGYWSNPGDGFFDDKLELMTQSLVSATSLTKAKFLYSGSQAMGSAEYKNELGKTYKDLIESGLAEKEEDRHVYSVVKRLSGFLIEKFKAGDSFVVVSHSQGNFFAEAVDAYIRVLVDPSEISKYERNVKYVGFASVAGSTPNNRYISANEDIALDAHFLATASVLNFSMLPRNFNICKYLYIKCYWPLNGADLWTKHGFQEIYTSDLPDSENKTTLSREMASLIKASLDELRKSSSDFVENFNGSTLDSSKWTSAPCLSAGDPAFAGNGQVHFGPCQSASTQGKVTFSGKKIVIEARFAGPKGSGRDTAIALVNATTGDFFQFGDTDYESRGLYAYLYYGGKYESINQYGGTTTAFKEYRVTIEGRNVTIQRGDSLSNLTETHTAILPYSATDGTYYLRIGTGASYYAPADFDWIRVTTDATNQLNGHRYEVIDCGSWSQCQMAAVLRGGKLATIRSKAENDWIVSTLLPMSKNEWGLWIGYTNAGHEGRWTWDSGESASYTNWAPGEPNNSGGAEHYAHILNVASNPGSWNDLYENGFGYVSQAIIEYSK